MDIKKHRLILEVIEQLLKRKSWTGKTHVIKTLFLIKFTGLTETPFEFVLYKHGPYSFEIEAEIEEMLSYSAINYNSRMPGYGGSFEPGKNREYVHQQEKLSEDQKRTIEKVCKFVNKRDVKDLERLATMAWTRKIDNMKTEEDAAQRLQELKPHIPKEKGIDAFRELDELVAT